MRKIGLLVVLAAIGGGGLAGCGSSGGSGSSGNLLISGAGSTFDAPLFSTAFAKYGHNLKVNYQALGSGTGQTDLDGKTVDFGAFDVPMLSTDGFKNFSKVVQFPVALGGVAVIYNLPGYSAPLKLTGGLLSAIYRKKITSWNDPRLVSLNPGLKSLSGAAATINVVHRSDSSGTSYIFTDFLSHTDSSWQSAYGASKLPAWPVGQGGNGSTQVEADVKHTQGSIGYVEVSYFIQNPQKGVGDAEVQNQSEQFLKPSLAGISADAAAVGQVSTTAFSIVDSPGAASYPISGFSWAGMYQEQTNAKVCAAQVKLFKWMVTAGQKYGPKLDYVKLPSADSRYSTTQLNSVTC